MPVAGMSKLHDEVRLEHICSYWAMLSAPEVIGPLAEGLRMNVYVTEGEIFGPRIRGRFRPGGGDWLSLRHDGIGVLDVRATLELEDGGLIYTATAVSQISDRTATTGFLEGPRHRRFNCGSLRATTLGIQRICGSTVYSA